MSTAREAEGLFRQQLEHCRKLSEQHQRDDVVSKALGFAQKAVGQLTRCDSSSLLVSSPAREALQSYTQSVLDSTYHRECQLVEGSFPDDVAKHEISSIIDDIRRPVSLCGSTENVQAVLGTDQFECVNWRVGALLYMYVHQLMASERRREAEDTALIRESCVLGVCHLALMLSAKTPLSLREDFSSNDPTLPQLLQEGIFSDIHMLALMYSGELCYWAWETEKSEVKKKTMKGEVGETGVGRGPGEDGERGTRTASMTSEKLELQTHSGRGQPLAATPPFSSLITQMKGHDYWEKYRRDFSAVDVGQSLLTKYIKLAQGPLKSQNWNYARAVELVVQLKRGC